MTVLKGALKCLYIIIIFQLSIGNVIASPADGSRRGQNVNSDSYVLNILSFSNELESGELFNKDPKAFDVFKLADQRVEIYQKGKVAAEFSLNDHRIDKPTLSYTKLTPRYNPETKELIFEASRGQNNQGEGGVLVARHIIPNVDMVAMNHDKEILSFVDSEGKLHAIDMGYVISQVFNNPIPTFRNLWAAQNNIRLSRGNVELSYITRGVRPVSDELSAEAVVPRNKNGEVEFTAGDLLVRYTDGSGEKLLGVFSRQVTYKKIQEGSSLLSIFGALLSPTQETTKFFAQNQALLESIVQTNSESVMKALNASSPLQNIEVGQLKTLLSRVQSIEFFSENRFDKFTQAEWNADYKRYKEISTDTAKLEFLAKHAHLLQEKAVGDEYKKIYADAITDFLGDLESQKRIAQPDGLAKSWQVLTEPASDNDLFAKKDRANKAKQTESGRKAEWKFIGVVAAGLATYLGGAMVIPNVEAFQQISAISWIYEHIYTDVMKDASYKYPLSYSILSLVGIWPAALALSLAFEKTLKAVNHTFKNSNSALALFVRDFQRTWGELSDWQRIISLGMRAYSFVVFPYVRVAVESLMQQKAFFSAYENGINPLKRIPKDSELARKVGLEKGGFVGLNNPLARGEKKIAEVEKKKAVQSELAMQKQRLESLSWMLATMAVAEKSGIDPASLLQVSENKATPEQIKEIFSNPEKQRKAELINQAVLDQLKESKSLAELSDIKQLSPEKIAEYYLAAKEAAEKINAQSAIAQKAKLRWKKIKAAPVNALNFLFLENGKADAKFLRSIITNNFVSNQVKQEFRNDHLMVVLLTAFVGDRADLSNPKSLTADRNGFLFTSHEHNYDMAINTFAHFFVSGASLALVFQKLRALQETNYLPKEDFEFMSRQREEGFLRGLKSWFTVDYANREDKPKNPLKRGVHFMYHVGTEADFGGIMVKRVSKRLSTIQAGVTMAVVLRTMVGGQDLGTAMSAWALMFIAGHWFYGWVWDPVQRGNQMTEERIEKLDRELKEHRFELSRALKESDWERADRAYQKIVRLYEKFNAKDVGRLKALLQTELGKITPTKPNTLAPSEMQYLGLIARLAKANHDKNQPEFDRTIELLRKVIVEKQGYDKAEVAKLNAQSILEFTRTNPPIYTHPNKFLSEFFTWNGAVWSTYLYIPLSIMLFSAEDLSVQSLVKWLFISTGLYASAWALLGRTPWLAYEKAYKKVSARFARTKSQERARPPEPASRFKIGQKAPSAVPVGGSCSRLFL